MVWLVWFRPEQFSQSSKVQGSSIKPYKGHDSAHIKDSEWQEKLPIQKWDITVHYLSIAGPLSLKGFCPSQFHADALSKGV